MVEKVSGNIFAEILALSVFGRNDSKAIEERKTSIWMACLTNETADPSDDIYFNGAIPLIERLRSLAEYKKRKKGQKASEEPRNVCVYVFDLAYTWGFLLPILENYYKFSHSSRLEYKDKYVYNALNDETAANVWAAELKFAEKDGIILFKDISKLYPGQNNIKDLADSFGITRTIFPIDDDIHREKDYEPTIEETITAYNSSMMIIDMLKEMSGDEVFFRSFSAASYSMKKMIDFCFGWANQPYMVFKSAKMYPTLDAELEQIAREALAGGLVGINHDVVNEDGSIDQPMLYVDKNMMYSYIQSSYYTPYGKPTLFEGKVPSVGKKISLFKVKITHFSWVNFNIIPSFEKKELTFFDGEMVIWLWDFEYYMMPLLYEDLEAEVLQTLQFKARITPFKQYYEHNAELRYKYENEGNKYFSAYYKGLNNAVIGKFIQKTKEIDYEAFIDDNGEMSTKEKKKDRNHSPSYTYTFLGDCTIARARCEIANLAKEFGFENVVYKETDALIVLDNARTRKVLKTLEIGQGLYKWKVEYLERGQFAASKRYKAETVNGKLILKTSGVTMDKTKTYDETKISDENVSMRVKARAKGGFIYLPIEKYLKGVDDD